MRFARRRDSDRFVILDIDRRGTPGNHLPVTGDDVPLAHLIPDFGDLLIDGHTPGLDEPISFAPRADTVLREEFVDADGVSHKRGIGLVDPATGFDPPQHAVDQPGDAKLRRNEPFDRGNFADVHPENARPVG